jgi:4-hydroxybenzoate polyprenyltransferase
VSAFDIIYALQDDEFDRSNRLYSVPSALGRKGALIVSAVIHILTAGLIVFAGLAVESGLFYWAGSAIFIGLLGYQHLIVKPDDLSRVNLAFGTTNGIASIIFALFTILGLWLRSS